MLHATYRGHEITHRWATIRSDVVSDSPACFAEFVLLFHCHGLIIDIYSFRMRKCDVTSKPLCSLRIRVSTRIHILEHQERLRVHDARHGLQLIENYPSQVDVVRCPD
jgi:hypothetical protein